MSDFYIQAAQVLDGVQAQTGSLKGLVMERSKVAKVDAKRLLALTANTLAYWKALDTVLERSDFMKLEKRAITTATAGKSCSATSLARAVAHDLLFTKRARIATSPAWPPHAAFVRHAARLKAELVKLQLQQGKATVQELRSGEVTRRKAERIPRWIRVNERLTTVEALVSQLQTEGWQEVQKGSLLSPRAKTFARSLHIDSVLAVHSAHTSTLLAHPLYQRGHIMLQDLASCFPAQILLHAITEEQVVHALDATSAPGNKTSHLSAQLSRAGKGSDVVALEQSQQRFQTLHTQLKRAGALDTNRRGYVKPILGDFLQQDPKRYPKVTHMLLDPSCSGSGILGRLDYLTEDQEGDGVENGSDATHDIQQKERLQGLATFQASMIDHAMHFPNLVRLVYSTCSIHCEENEEVVMKALASDVAKKRGWRLAKRTDVLPSWPTRGKREACQEDQALADAMIRCVPGGSVQEDREQGSVTATPHMEATNGFFVTCFIRQEGQGVSEPGDQSQSQTDTTLGVTTVKNRKRKQRAKEKARQQKRAKIGAGEGQEEEED